MFVPRRIGWPLGCEEQKTKAMKKKKVVSLGWNTTGGNPMEFLGRGKTNGHLVVTHTHTHTQ
jgi:hypothetical protein